VAPGEWDEVAIKRGPQSRGPPAVRVEENIRSVFLMQPRLTPSLGPGCVFKRETGRIDWQREELMHELIARFRASIYFAKRSRLK